MRSVLFILSLLPVATAAAQINVTNSSVNSQLNVMAPPYNAKGDCVTDDHDAILAAFTASAAAAVGHSTPPTVYFPHPPGGCYMTSALEYNGVPLQGQPSQIGLWQGSVILKGKPGQDILHISDPSVVALNLWGLLWVKDISFLLDDSVDVSASHPHRIIGRAFDDANISLGSTTLTTSQAKVSCGDIGQNIRIMGAGTSGAPLDTTIASIRSCFAAAGTSVDWWNPIQLRTAASTTVSNAHAVIGVNGYPDTQTVGNAAIAFDNSNPAGWLTPRHNTSNQSYGLLENVNISSTSGVMNSKTGVVGQNNTAGIYWQSFAPYGLKAENVNIWRTYYGVIQGCADTNSYKGSCAQDLQTWKHMMIQATNPVITYDGLFNTWQSIQICGANGMDFLDLGVAGEYSPDHLTIDTVEHECQPSSGGYGYRINSNDARLQTVPLGRYSELSYLDGSGIRCTGCEWGTLNINGFDNHVTGGGGTAINGGRNNTVKGAQNSGNAFRQMPGNTPFAFLIDRRPYVAGEMSGESFADGNAATTRPTGYSRDDFQFFPEDVAIDQKSGEYVGYESGSPTGRYLWFVNGEWMDRFTNLMYGANNNGGYIGVSAASPAKAYVPATAGTWYVLAACGGSGTASMKVISSGGGAPVIGQFTMSCSGESSTYTLQTMRTPNLATVPPGAMEWNNSGSVPIKVAYMQYVPDLGSVNGMTFAPGGAQIPTQASTATVANDIVTYDSTTGHQHDSGVSLPVTGTLGAVFSGTTASMGGSPLIAGQCVLAQVTVKGAAIGMVVAVSPAGAGPGAGFTWQGWVAGANSVTVSLCAIVAGTPHAATYNYRVIQ
jgi:hypothetical protein